MIYEVYKLFNIVTNKKDIANAVLIQSLELVEDKYHWLAQGYSLRF